ncbi:hypothetical protein GRAQ_04477 [Rahnella aquatilis CIP 78.65 = ATCC 33071]|uniref:Lysine-specific metallo-endopeptidase domain-containing protein n=2 Tax=Rahnella aquatilis TaxID=34038 RepID=H2J1Z9_RAHAC|nr:hypothetical protein [Rahnella aquatilis]AEX54596.1 hypothetical protein Rahaq2_4879 [Rahnella aquatilis CIP 78.65 = ATCC 33071]KFD00196.1 hypothetical protein GRAQ_04477 [Rahnella aquatilis CIP 78.65 = ATCC 33071]
MHPAEERLKRLLPFIITTAKQQVNVALEALERRKLSDDTRKILKELLNEDDSATVKKLTHSLNKIRRRMTSLAPEHFDLAEELYEAGGDTIGYVKATDAKDFKKGTNKKYIALSYIHTGRMHVDDIAATVIHELSHLILNTEDHAYSICMSKQASGLFTPWSVKELHSYARGKNSNPLNNAETLSRIVLLIYFSVSKLAAYKKAYALYWESGDNKILAFHRMEPGQNPRISSPVLARKSNKLRIVNGHVVI